MTSVSADIQVSDKHIAAPRGRLFARAWSPAGPVHAPAVILLHDSLGCVALWRDFPAALAARTGRRVIAYDRLGFGRSDPYPGPLPLDFIDHECRAALPPLLAAFDVGRFVLFGHSVGGGMSVAGAAAFPARCAGLITESAQIFPEPLTFDGVRHARAVFVPGSAPYERLTRYHGGKADWVLRSWIDTWLDPDFVLALAPAMRALACPVLALHGDRDEYGSVAQPKMLCDTAPGPSTLHILKDCAHVPHRDRPEEVLDAVAAFLR
jgi:pimeloyl-ACP methyl ester carboxylesterase